EDGLERADLRHDQRRLPARQVADHVRDEDPLAAQPALRESEELARRELRRHRKVRVVDIAENQVVLSVAILEEPAAVLDDITQARRVRRAEISLRQLEERR